jgi:rubrerythrin
MNFDSLMGKSAQVYFCNQCDDQPPWRAEKIENCPTCKTTEGVVGAQRFQNLTTETDGTTRNV